MEKLTEEMREAASSMAQERALPTADRRTLSDIASGKRKWIRWEWWEEVHGVVSRAKIAKIAEMADPERNPFENERNVAAAKLAGLKARTRRAPGSGPEPPPLPSSWSEVLAHGRAARAARAEKRQAKTRPGPPTPQPAGPVHPTSDSVAAPPPTAAEPPPLTERKTSMSDSVAALRELNAHRAARRAQARAGLTCQHCGKPLAARRLQGAVLRSDLSVKGLARA